MIRFFFMAATAVLLSSCQTTDIYEKGKGPITLAPNVIGAFERYKLAHSPSYFAISYDGRNSGSSTCPVFYSGCEDDSGNIARNLCNKNAGVRGSSCAIFAIGREVVWDGPVNMSTTNADYVFIFAKEAAGTSSTYTGTGRIAEGGRKIILRVGQCRGEADLNTKKWFVDKCKNNYSASGSFVAGEGAEKYYGFGTSSTDDTIDFKLMVPSVANSLASTPKSAISPAAKIGKPPRSSSALSVTGTTLPNHASNRAISGYKERYSTQYAGSGYHKAFVVASNGSYGWTTSQDSRKSAIAQAFKRCKKYTDDCRLYDLDGAPIDGLSKEEALAQNAQGAYANSIKTSDQTVDEKIIDYTSPLSLVVEWTGHPNILVGTIRYPKKKDGTFLAKFPSDNLDCSGSYSFSNKKTGVWNITCSNGDASTGTFVTDPSGSTGTGVDTKGQKVKYTVRPATG